MNPSRTADRLPILLEALGRPETHSAVTRLLETIGDRPVEVRERTVGEPGYLSRCWMFGSGEEVILHDDAIVAIVLRVRPTPAAPFGVDLSRWIPRVGSAATLDDLSAALGSSPHFTGIGAPSFELDGGFVRAAFLENRGWKDPGRLETLTVTAIRPGTAPRPEDDGCPSCADLLVRDGGAAVDVDATVDALAAAIREGLLREDLHWARLADLRAIHASGLMERVESQLTCLTCRRIVCLTLFRDRTPTFRYHVLDDARRHRMEPIPPVELWGDAARQAAEADAMHYVDHEPGRWFLVERGHDLYLQARYSLSSMIDDSALIRLEDAERERYRADGRGFLTELADALSDDPPHREKSRYHTRDLYGRGAESRRLQDEVTAAIVNHTWLAQQRRATPRA